MEAENKHKFKFLIKRILKSTPETLDENGKVLLPKIEFAMWGLFALEDIPTGAFIMEYTGEIITKKEGDKRGNDYDKVGMSYLFDMNDSDEANPYEKSI